MKPLFLPIHRALVGDERAAFLFQRCRHAAHRIDQNATLAAEYLDHQRVGWTVSMCDDDAVQQMILCYRAIMDDQPLPVLE